MIQETNALFGDGSHILYVNAQIKDNTALGQLMHDFACTKAEEMHYPILAKRVRYFKEEQEGVATMSRIFEEIKREAAQEAARKTAREKSIQVARRMLMMGKYQLRRNFCHIGSDHGRSQGSGRGKARLTRNTPKREDSTDGCPLVFCCRYCSKATLACKTFFFTTT